MGRAILLLALLYGWGDGRLEAYRPAALDRPLRLFHGATDQAIADARRALAAIDDVRSMRHLTPLIRYLDRP
jgi:hypothetical protein